MELDNIWCGDLEADNLLEEATKIHVLTLAYKNKIGEWKLKSTPDYGVIKDIFSNPKNIIAIHNGIRYDAPLVEKILGIEVKAEIIDTLALAWYIDPNRTKQGKKYGLAYYGEDTFNTPKPPIEDWENLTYEQYKFRCEEDTKITYQLWDFLLEKARKVYDTDEGIVRIIRYLNFLMKCAQKQESQKIQVDVERLTESMAYFEKLKEEKFILLSKAMPTIPIYKTVTFPKKGLYKADGSLSVAGEKYLSYVKGCGLNLSYEGPIQIVTKYEEANPNSVKQKKDWLLSLGWVPETFSYTRDKETQDVKKVEQILTEEKSLCPSVLKLIAKDPAIELLDGMSILTHRIGIFKGLLKNMDKDGFVVQGLTQLANSLRWQHSVIVNFPKVTGSGDIRDGKWVRDCLIAGKGNKIVQSDLSGIESRTSDHYTFPINPARVFKTKEEYFDPHTEISVFANLMTSDEEIWFKFKKEVKGNPNVTPELFGTPSEDFHRLLSLTKEEEKLLMDKLKLSRSKGKVTNYSSLYLVGPKTLARSLSISEKEAKELIESYWKIHYAVKEFSESLIHKEVEGQLWVYNPMSKFWMAGRSVRSNFSLINQSSAVYCFNMWVWNITKLGLWPIAQTHDDLVIRCLAEDVEKTKDILNLAMENLNKQLKLNVEVACEIEVGDDFSQTH